MKFNGNSIAIIKWAGGVLIGIATIIISVTLTYSQLQNDIMDVKKELDRVDIRTLKVELDNIKKQNEKIEDRINFLINHLMK